MRHIVGQEKPSLDSIEHHGVKGMHWGNRKTGPEIRTARANISTQAAKVRQQERKTVAAIGTKSAAKEQAKLSKMKIDFLNNPDRVTAAKMTRGEKIAAVLLTGVATPATLVSAGAIAGTAARSRVIAKRQKSGYYNNHK